MGCCGHSSVKDVKRNINYQCKIKGADPSLIPEMIIDALYNSITRIEFKDKENDNTDKISTGFFLKININNKNYYFLFTCYHSISKKHIDSKIIISIYYGKAGEESKKTIELDSNKRIIQYYEELDTTLIQILSEDKISENQFLFPDFNYKSGFEQYENIQIFTAGYPDVKIHKGEKHLSTGIIKTINYEENYFEHTCDTRQGSSGSPLLKDDKFIIGMHYGCDKKKTINYGVFIGLIIDKLNLDIIKRNEEKERKSILNKEEEKKRNLNKEEERKNELNDIGENEDIKNGNINGEEKEDIKNENINEEEDEKDINYIKQNDKEGNINSDFYSGFGELLRGGIENNKGLFGIEGFSIDSLKFMLQNPAYLSFVQSAYSNPKYIEDMFNTPQSKELFKKNPFMQIFSENPEIMKKLVTPESTAFIAQILTNNISKENSNNNNPNKEDKAEIKEGNNNNLDLKNGNNIEMNENLIKDSISFFNNLTLNNNPNLGQCKQIK